VHSQKNDVTAKNHIVSNDTANAIMQAWAVRKIASVCPVRIRLVIKIKCFSFRKNKRYNIKSTISTMSKSQLF